MKYLIYLKYYLPKNRYKVLQKKTEKLLFTL
jgi:hypothetical protein